MPKLKYTPSDLEVYAFLLKNKNNPKIFIAAKYISDFDMSLMVLSEYFPCEDILDARKTLEVARLNNFSLNYFYKRKKASAYISNKTIRMEVFDLHGNKCLNCGTYEDICLDHITSVVNGGENDIQNLQPLCRSCNSSKGSKTIDYRN